MTGKKSCGHEGCKCFVDTETAVAVHGISFCSQRCADDRGCDHEGCNCGVFPKEEPAPAPAR